MKKYLNSLVEKRKMLLDITAHLKAEQYNTTPPGHNNNIIWNMGHALVVSESYLYRNTSFQAPTHGFDISLFKKGTRPEQAFSMYGISLVRQSLFETVPVYEKKTVSSYQLTGLGIPQSDSLYPVSEAFLQFILFHEDIHYHAIEKMLRLM